MSRLLTPWRAVAAMFVLNGALFGIWASRIPAIAEQHQLGPANLGLLLLLLAGGAIVAFPLAGRWSDQFGAALVTLRIGAAYTGALVLIAAAPSYTTLAMALFLFGATHGAMDVAMNTWAGEVERHIGRPVMSSFHAMFSLGAGLGAGSGYFAASAGMSPTMHFIVAGLLIAMATFAFARIGWQSERRERRSGDPVFALPRGPLVAVGFVAFCSALGEGAMADWSAIFLVLSTGVSEASAALGYAVFSMAMVITRLLGDRVIQRVGTVTAARLAGSIAASGAVLAVLFESFATTLAGFALMGVGYAVVVPLAFSRAANDPTMSSGAAIASVATLGYGGLLLGPPVIGFVAEATSLRMGFLLLAVLAVVIVVMARSLALTRSAPAHEQPGD